MAGEEERLTKQEVRLLVDERLRADGRALRSSRPSRNRRFSVWVVDVGDVALSDGDAIKARLVVTDARAVYEISPDQSTLDDLMLALGRWPGADPSDVFNEEEELKSSRRTLTATAAMVLDVDGVVSPVHPTEPTWGDEVQAGTAIGAVMVSPMLCQRLAALAALPSVAPA